MTLFPWFKNRKIRKDAAARLYDIAVTNARDPVYYEQMGVADTIDGRFDLLTLQVFLIMNRLNELGPDGHKLAQALFDRMFKMIDLTLREMGIGDMGIPKHMKKMMKAFNGRAHSYRAALDSRDGDVLLLAVARNVYRASEAIPAGAQDLAEHVIDLYEAYQAHDLERFMSGALSLPRPVIRTRKEAAYA